MTHATTRTFPLPLAATLALCLSGCAGDAYFIHAKNQKRYNGSDISNHLFDERSDGDSRYDASIAPHPEVGRLSESATSPRERYRDSGIVGRLYYDPDGEGRGEKPYEFTIRKAQRAYHLEAALTDPIPVGKHAMTPHLSLGHHRDQKAVAGVFFRVPF